MKLTIYTFAIHRDGEVGVEVHSSYDAHYKAVRKHCLSYYRDMVKYNDDMVESIEDARANLRKAEAADIDDLISMYQDSTDCSIHRAETVVEVPILDRCRSVLVEVEKLHDFHCDDIDEETSDLHVEVRELISHLDAIK